MVSPLCGDHCPELFPELFRLLSTILDAPTVQQGHCLLAVPVNQSQRAPCLFHVFESTIIVIVLACTLFIEA